MNTIASYGFDRPTRIRLGLLFLSSALMIASVLIGWLRPDQSTLRDGLALAGALLVTFPIVIELITAVRASGFAATRFYMDQYVVLALAACLATQRYVTGGIVAIVLLFGQILEERTTLGMEMAVSKLRKLGRIRAHRLRGNDEEEIEATGLTVGDHIRIGPGEPVPADAMVLSGHAVIDQSHVTGESVPVEVSAGTAIFAGTSNVHGTIRAEVTGMGSQTVMGRVEAIIEEAKASSSPIISMTEEYAKYYTPLILLIAACVFFFTQDIQRAIAVLVVSIPCAFVLASPSAMISAIASAARMGLLVKSVRHLESARLVDTVVFDKTGTLTRGELEVEDVLIHEKDFDTTTVTQLAVALESQSSHPVAQAICRSMSGPAEMEATQVTESAGLGLEGGVNGVKVMIGRIPWLADQGVPISIDAEGLTRHSLVALAVDGLHVATFLLADKLRPEAAETVQRLQQLGISDFLMLTGDREEVAGAIAAAVGIRDYHAGCLPEDKLRHILNLKDRGRRVMVVGDGLNDAPALAEGNLGVAIGTAGNDVTLLTSDVALMSHDLRRLPDLLLLSARTVGIINSNLLCGLVFIALAIVLSSCGWISPVAAAFFHEFSAFFVIFNSARLLKFEGMADDDAPADECPALATA
ncbi:cadmium-translocating P-type ATPase [Luteolibacter ambystomatis]|uniref:P-type Zn(2+) transporter n=1 Tax=Luteolibacter ambystomatis TaxID=2824561 RepID=A0A975PG04_9BACT|nr:cation-translocating P-type ATPase [Luteolibacter ambystomatis]QUE51896.1 cadmium-translocating P-type ATPase [Luteolibacter ambystomatis]